MWSAVMVALLNYCNMAEKVFRQLEQFVVINVDIISFISANLGTVN